MKYNGIDYYPTKYEGYFVSACGKVFSKKTNKNIKIQNSGGYDTISISDNGNMKTKKVHRLIMETLRPNETTMQVNHIDGNKSNNNINNLEWCTPTENMIHAHRVGLHPGPRKKLSKPIIDLGNGVYYLSLTEACIILGYNQATLSMMLNNKIKNKTNLKYA